MGSFWVVLLCRSTSLVIPMPGFQSSSICLACIQICFTLWSCFLVFPTPTLTIALAPGCPLEVSGSTSVLPPGRPPEVYSSVIVLSPGCLPKATGSRALQPPGCPPKVLTMSGLFVFNKYIAELHHLSYPCLPLGPPLPHVLCTNV